MCWISRQGCEGDTKPSVKMRFDFACKEISTEKDESAEESDLNRDRLMVFKDSTGTDCLCSLEACDN